MRSNPDLDALVRKAQESGAKVLGIRLSDAGPVAVTRADARVDGPPAPAPGPSKYRNVRAEHGGLRYDSKAEAAYAATLDLEAKACPGMCVIRQATFHLGCPENRYRVDFLVYSPESPTPIRAIDVKGHRTAKFEHDVKLWRAYGPCPLVIVTRKGKGWASETIEGRIP